MNHTYIPSKKQKEITWFLVDATNQRLGRLASQIVKLIQGKLEINYTPGFDSKVHVIVINAEKICFTGKKLSQKRYFRHSGRPGHLKTTTLANLFSKFPSRIIELSVKRMLPNGFAKSYITKRLKVYNGENHPHQAQKPKQILLSL